MVKKARYRYWSYCFGTGLYRHLYRGVNHTFAIDRWAEGEWTPDPDRYWRVILEFDEVHPRLANRILDGLKSGDYLPCKCGENSSCRQTLNRNSDKKIENHEEKTEMPIILNEIEHPHEFTTLRTSAVAMHELFLAFLSAGFTEDQSLKMICQLIKSE